MNQREWRKASLLKLRLLGHCQWSSLHNVTLTQFHKQHSEMHPELVAGDEAYSIHDSFLVTYLLMALTKPETHGRM